MAVDINRYYLGIEDVRQVLKNFDTKLNLSDKDVWKISKTVILVLLGRISHVLSKN